MEAIIRAIQCQEIHGIWRWYNPNKLLSTSTTTEISNICLRICDLVLPSGAWGAELEREVLLEVFQSWLAVTP